MYPTLNTHQSYYFFADRNGHIAHTSEALRQLSGHYYAALEGSPLDNLFSTPQSTGETLTLMLKTQNNITNLPVCIQHTQGQRLHVLLNISSVHNDHGEICGYEGSLAQQLATPQDSLEKHITPLIRLAPNGTVVYANHASEALLAALGGEVGGVLHHDWHQHIQQVLQSKSIFSTDVATPQTQYHCKFIPQDGELFIAAVANDAFCQQQLAQQSTTENNCLSLRGIAHDINNMIGVVIGNASLIRRFPEDISGTETRIKRIFKAAQTATQLCEELCSEKPNVEKHAPISMAEVLKHTASMLEGVVNSRAIQLDFRTAHDNVNIQGNIQQIQRVMMNLILNATESMQGKHGQIHVSNDITTIDQPYIDQCHGYHDAKVGDYMYVDIQDNGCGMDQYTVQHLFEPFHSNKKQQGHGLGMATVLQMMQSHQGLVHISSTDGEGTAMRILFPMLPAAGKQHQVNTLLHDIAKRHSHDVQLN